MKRFVSFLEGKGGIVLAVLILTGYVGITVGDVVPGADDKYPDYHDHVVPFLEDCSVYEIPMRYQAGIDGTASDKPTRSPLKWYSICASYHIFENENVIPFMFSIGSLGLTFVLAKGLTGRNFVGLIAMGVLLSTVSFTRWDTSATYDQSWTFFLMVSLTSLYYFPRMTGVPYLLSVLSKGLTLMYLPMFLYTMWVEKDTKGYWSHFIWIAISSAIVIVPISIAVLFMFADNPNGIVGAPLSFSMEDLVEGLWIWLFYFSDDQHIMLSIIPLMIYLLSQRNKVPGADVVVVWLGGIIITVPVILGFSDQLVHPYRFVPFTIFYSIGIGIVVKQFIEKYLISTKEIKV